MKATQPIVVIECMCGHIKALTELAERRGEFHCSPCGSCREKGSTEVGFSLRASVVLGNYNSTMLHTHLPSDAEIYNKPLEAPIPSDNPSSH
jgi:hypothetical protein